MNRHDLALSLVPHETDLDNLGKALSACAIEAMDDGVDPTTDAAVLLIGAQIGYVTHSDITLTMGRFKLLVEHCQTNQSPSNIVDFRRH